MSSQIPPTGVVAETPTTHHSTAAPSQTPPSILALTPAAKESSKRKRAVWINDIDKLLDIEPTDYEAAWKELKARVSQPILENGKTLALSSLKHTREALQLFGLTEGDTNPFTEIKGTLVPQYLKDNIKRIYTVTNSIESNTKAFSRTVLDQILISSIYKEGKGLIQPPQQVHNPKENLHRHPSTPATHIQEDPAEQEDPAKLELLHEMPLSKLVIHNGESKHLSGFADYSI